MLQFCCLLTFACLPACLRACSSAGLSPCLPQEHAFIRVPTLRAQFPYALTDQGFNLRNRDFNITVSWNVMPRVGGLYTRHRTFPGR